MTWLVSGLLCFGIITYLLAFLSLLTQKNLKDFINNKKTDLTMKKSENNPIKSTAPSTMAVKSLFSSIIANEANEALSFEVTKLASRVGLVGKVLVGRNMHPLFQSFQEDVSKLVQDYCSRIDNELRSTEED